MGERRNDVVAIVDDDSAVRDSLRFLLEAAGWPVAVYASAKEFLDDRAADLACLIVDEQMPGTTGLELAARLRQDGSDLPIALVTGSPSAAITERAARIGIDTVIEKPWKTPDLLSFINAHVTMPHQA